MRDDEDSEIRPDAPAPEDKCYTRGRLRDEFRMKPAPGAEPVRMYKNPYGGKYGVWRLATVGLHPDAGETSADGKTTAGQQPPGPAG